MCDTFVALPPATVDGSVIFGKNSDREPNEAQVLEYHPPEKFPEDATVSCTYIEIPQASETNAVLLSRPFWMWGAEIGANDKGVVIGNEAVWTKMPLVREGRITGMDLLRLALERGDTAELALEIITELLADYGQGGICSYVDKQVTYHNSFIIADPQEAWVLETAGHLWAALKVKSVYSISNGLTIGEEFDLSHPDLINTARKKNWLKKGKTFHFARNYSDWFYTTFSSCRLRRQRSYDLVRSHGEPMSVAKSMKILRDHGSNEYRPDSHFLMNHICAHSANSLARHATQSTGSLVAHLERDRQTYWATGTSAPCISIFKPVWFGENVLPDPGPLPKETFNPDSLWWRHEQLHRTVLQDFPRRSRAIRTERDEFERTVEEKVDKIRKDRQYDFTKETFTVADALETGWLEQVRSLPVVKKPGNVYRRYWAKQNQSAGIAVR